MDAVPALRFDDLAQTVRKLLVAVIVVAFGWKGFDAYQRASLAAQPADADPAEWFFINHCPSTKMDGNNDGVPCESQWCGR